MDSMWQDLRYAWRSLRHNPGTVALAVLSLALGIGANATIFSAVDVFMIRPLPYPDANELMAVFTVNDERGWSSVDFSIPDFIDLREQSETIAVAGWQGNSFNVSGDGLVERLTGHQVTHNYFDVVGIAPVRGRTFVEEEERQSAERVVIISDGVWHRRYGGRPYALGTTISLDSEPHTIVGIMPPRFWLDDPGIELWRPMTRTGEENRDGHVMEVIGRLRDGATLEAARAELEQISSGIAETYAGTSAGNRFRVIPLREDIFNEGFRVGSTIATVAVAFVLLIACANVANLMLVRSAGRTREVALRGALGASRVRIIRQFLTESLVVAGLGGTLGVLLAFAGIRGLVSLMPAWFPQLDEIVLSGRVLAFTAIVSVLTGVLFGLAPAFQSARSHLTDSLREGGRGGTGMRGGRIRKALVVVEISLSLILLVSSALLVQGFMRVRTTDYGFERAEVLGFRVDLPQTEYPDPERIKNFYTAFTARLASVPGVESVGGSTRIPFRGNSSAWYSIPGEDVPDDSRRPVVAWRYVLPGYFATLEIPIRRGRVFDSRDEESATRTMVVNEGFATTHWPEGNALGRLVEMGDVEFQIVGVVANVFDTGPEENPEPIVYLSAQQRPVANMAWFVRMDGDPTTLVGTIRSELAGVDPDLPMYAVETLDGALADDAGGDLLMAKLMIVVAGIAVVLALGGVYGVMSYSIAQRTQELGIRMALGARHRDVAALVLKQGVRLSVVGVAVGVVLALGVTRSLSLFLFGVNPFDPVTFATVALLLLTAGIGATYLPARRATRVDPVIALRTE